jgi:hypothetical protein
MPKPKTGGRKRGTPNKRSIPVLLAAAREVLPDVDVAGLQRYVLAGILGEIEKVRASTVKYDASELVDWYVKLGRAVETYANLDHVHQQDFVHIRAELDRLNPEQILALKQFALIASGGSTRDTPAPRGAAARVRRTIQGKARREGEGKDTPKR